MVHDSSRLGGAAGLGCTQASLTAAASSDHRQIPAASVIAEVAFFSHMLRGQNPGLESLKSLAADFEVEIFRSKTGG